MRRVGEVERGKFKSDCIVPVGEHEGIETVGDDRDGRVAVRRLDLRQDDGGAVGVVVDLIREEGGQAIHAAEEEFAPVVFEGCASVELGVAQSIAGIVGSESKRLRIPVGKVGQPAVGADPELVSFVFEDRVDIGGGQPLLRAVVLRGVGFRVEAGQAPFAAQPEDAPVVFLDGQQALVGYRHHVLQAGVRRESLSVGGQPEESAVGGAKPEQVRTVEVKRLNERAVRTLVFETDRDVFEKAGGGIEAMQAVVGRQPEPPPSILTDRVDRRLV